MHKPGSTPIPPMSKAAPFVVAWQSGYFTGAGQDGSTYGVYAQRYTFVPELAGDMDDDNDVDAADIDILADMIFRGASDPGNNDSADLDWVDGVYQDDMDYMVSTIFGTVYGDADLDDDVDGADFDAWRIRDSLGGGIGWATADWDGDNDVDGNYGIYAQLYATHQADISGDFDDDCDVDADDIDILADILFRGALDPHGDDSANLDGVGGANQDDTDYMINTILATVYGDADLDDDVDGADFDAWRIRDSVGGGIGWATGDWDGDNDVDGADFDHWRLRLPAIGGAGQSVTASASGATGFASVAAATAPSPRPSPIKGEGVSDSTPSIAAVRAHERTLAEPDTRSLVSTIDEVFSTSPMYRSRHLRRGAVGPTHAVDAVFARRG